MFQSMGNATLLERAAKLYSRGAGMGRWKCEASFASDTEPESTADVRQLKFFHFLILTHMKKVIRTTAKQFSLTDDGGTPSPVLTRPRGYREASSDDD